MHCPNCGDNLTIVSCKNNLAVDHCDTCGGTYFKENEINRLTLADAKQLAAKKITATIFGTEKICPRDKKPLHAISSESVPQFVTLLQCEKCRGIFAYPDDLANFKRAQAAKIDYFKAWAMPLPHLRSVLVISFVLVISLSLFYSVSPHLRQSATIKADNTLCPLHISTVAHTTIIYCTTKKAFLSEARFKKIQSGEIITRAINQTPRQVHMISLTDDDISPSSNILVRFVFKSDNTELSTNYSPFLPNN